MTAGQLETVKAYPFQRRRTFGCRIRRVLRGVRWSFALALIKAGFHVAKAGGRPYQPVEIGGRRFRHLRDSEGRWQAIAEVLRRYEVRNLLDVGCAEGWFSRRAATECNCFSVGIEATDAIIVGELARLHDRVERVASLRAFMTPQSISALPKFEAVLCLSVLHHVIRGFGIASAEDFLRALATRVEKVLIFEIGTADETSWTAVLPGLGEGQEAFVTDLLRRCGFSNVQMIAETPAFHREAQRILFVAEPAAKLIGGHLDIRQSG